MNFLHGLVIGAHGTFPGGKDWNHGAIRRRIEGVKGTWSNKIDDLNVLISTEKAVEKQDRRVVQAHKVQGCTIVTLGWLKKCLKSQSSEPTAAYEVAWPGEEEEQEEDGFARKRIGSVSDEEIHIPGEDDESKARRRKRRGEAKKLDIPIEKFCNLRNTHRVYVERDGYPLSAHLKSRTKIGGVSRFVHLQVLQLIVEPDNPKNEFYYCWERTGTLGTHGEGRASGSGTLKNALEEFNKKCEIYTGAQWWRRYLCTGKEKYVYVGLNDKPLCAGKNFTESFIPTSSRLASSGLPSFLPEPIENLIRRIFDEKNLNAMRAKLVSVNFDELDLHRICHRFPVMKKSRKTAELDPSEVIEEADGKQKANKDCVFAPSTIEEALEILGRIERKIFGMPLEQEEPKVPSAVGPELLEKIYEEEARRKARKQSKPIPVQNSDEDLEDEQQSGLEEDAAVGDEPTKKAKEKSGKVVKDSTKSKGKQMLEETDEDSDDEPVQRGKAKKAAQRAKPTAVRKKAEMTLDQNTAAPQIYTIEALSAQYYKLIPRIPKAGPLLDSMELIKREVDLLKILRDYALAQVIIRDARSAEIKHMNEHKLKEPDRPRSDWLIPAAHMEPLTVIEPESIEYQELTTLLMGSLTPRQAQYYKVQQIYGLSRKSQESNHLRELPGYLGTMYGQRLLLWATHPSALELARLPALFRQGLVDDRPGPNSLYNFGSGIYLSDLAQAALYEIEASGTTRSNSGNVGLLVLCEVEIGVPHMELSSLTDNPYRLLPEGETVPVWDIQRVCQRKGIWTVKGLGKVGPQGTHTKQETFACSGFVQEPVAGTWKTVNILTENTFTGSDKLVAEYPDVSNGKHPGPTGVGGTELPYNQYVVYNESQIRLRYLFQVEMPPIEDGTLEADFGISRDLKKKLFPIKTVDEKKPISLADLKSINPEAAKARPSVKRKAVDKPEPAIESGPSPLAETPGNRRKVSFSVQNPAELDAFKNDFEVDREELKADLAPVPAAARNRGVSKVRTAGTEVEGSIEVDTESFNTDSAQERIPHKQKRKTASSDKSITTEKPTDLEETVDDKTEEDTDAPAQPLPVKRTRKVDPKAKLIAKPNAPGISEIEVEDLTAVPAHTRTTTKHVRKPVGKVASKAEHLVEPNPPDDADIKMENLDGARIPTKFAKKRVRKPTAKALSNPVCQKVEDIDTEPAATKRKRTDAKSKSIAPAKEPEAKKPKLDAGPVLKKSTTVGQPKRATRANPKNSVAFEDPVSAVDAGNDADTEGPENEPGLFSNESKATDTTSMAKIQKQNDSDVEYTRPKRATRARVPTKRSAKQYMEDPISINATNVETEIEAPVPKKRVTAGGAAEAAPKSKVARKPEAKAREKKPDDADATKANILAPVKRTTRSNTTQQQTETVGTSEVPGPVPVPVPEKRAACSKAITTSQVTAEVENIDKPYAEAPLPKKPAGRATRSTAATEPKADSMTNVQETELEATEDEVMYRKKPAVRSKITAASKSNAVANTRKQEDGLDATKSEENVGNKAPTRTRAGTAAGSDKGKTAGAAATTGDEVKGKRALSGRKVT